MLVISSILLATVIVTTKNLKEQRLRSSKAIETAKKLADLNDRLIDMNKRLIEEKTILAKDKKLLMEKEYYLLNAMNDALGVKEPKRFMVHRMSLAPWEPVDYEDKKEEDASQSK